MTGKVVWLAIVVVSLFVLVDFGLAWGPNDDPNIPVDESPLHTYRDRPMETEQTDEQSEPLEEGGEDKHPNETVEEQANGEKVRDNQADAYQPATNTKYVIMRDKDLGVEVPVACKRLSRYRGSRYVVVAEVRQIRGRLVRVELAVRDMRRDIKEAQQGMGRHKKVLDDLKTDIWGSKNKTGLFGVVNELDAWKDKAANSLVEGISLGQRALGRANTALVLSVIALIASVIATILAVRRGGEPGPPGPPGPQGPIGPQGESGEANFGVIQSPRVEPPTVEET